MAITETIKYIGVNDYMIDMFEGQYVVPEGMAYNSYVILGEKIAVLDTVDVNYTEEWFANMETVLEDRMPDYLIVQHMEPDHSAGIFQFASKYPDATIVASEKAFVMMKNFFGTDFAARRIVAGEGDQLDLGDRQLTFVMAPMIHWPEVMMTYDSKDKVFFSADAFGKFGTLDADEEDWACEARRYYFGIVGKYGAQVQKLLAKLANMDIKKICPLHGPMLYYDLGYYINLYDTWSGYRPEEEGVVINYTSIYGNTKKAAMKLAELLRAKGCPKVVVNDLARWDWAEAVEDAFRYDRMVLATTTYNGEIFPAMKQFIDHLTERGYSNRFVGFIENGSWAPQADRIMKSMLAKSKNLQFAANGVKILSAMDEENLAQLEALAEELIAGPAVEEADCEEAADAAPKKKFICKVCGYVHEADSLPEDFVCPLCKRGAEDFVEQ